MGCYYPLGIAKELSTYIQFIHDKMFICLEMLEWFLVVEWKADKQFMIIFFIYIFNLIKIIFVNILLSIAYVLLSWLWFEFWYPNLFIITHSNWLLCSNFSFSNFNSICLVIRFYVNIIIMTFGYNILKQWFMYNCWYCWTNIIINE